MSKSTLRTIIDNIESGAKVVKDTVMSVAEPVGKFVKKIVTLDGALTLPELASTYSTLEGLKASKAYLDADNATRLELLDLYQQQQASASSEDSFVTLDNNLVANYDLGTSTANLKMSSSEQVNDLIKNNVLTEGQSLTEGFAKRNEFLNFASAFNVAPDIDKEDKSQPTIKLG
jgi:hypothetical protein